MEKESIIHKNDDISIHVLVCEIKAKFLISARISIFV